jgi:hypothetical protein
MDMIEICVSKHREIGGKNGTHSEAIGNNNDIDEFNT